jgi:hypothetical protein
MGNKTRRKGQKRRVTRRKGGAINKLPNIPNSMTLEEFEDEYDVFYVSAHGGLVDSDFIVPKNTYLLHSVPSTFVCKMAGDDERLNRFYGQVDDYNDEGYSTNTFMPFIRNPRIVFEKIYRENNQLVRTFFNTSSTTNDLKRQSNITSLYEPSDIVPDVILQFYSYYVQPTAETGSSHFIAPGIFKIPMTKNTKSLRDSSFAAIARMTREGASKAVLERELTAKDSEFLKLPENLLAPIVNRTNKNTFKLSELLTFRELAASRTSDGGSKKRLFIIHACKSMMVTNNSVRGRRRATSVNRILASRLHRSNLPTQFRLARTKLENQERRERERKEQFELYKLTRKSAPRGILVPTNRITWNNIERATRTPESEVD